MKKTLISFILILFCYTSFAQRYMTRTGQVVFDASTSLEDIHAVNNESAAIFDASTGGVVFQVLIRSFKMEKALMQEHFNEDYLESSKYPHAIFKGKITNLDQISFTKKGNYKLQVEGKLTIHGISKNISLSGNMSVDGDKITVKTKFNIKPENYNVEIPSLVSNKIAKVIAVSITAQLNKM